MGNSEAATTCQYSTQVQMPTVRQAAQRLLDALDRLAPPVMVGITTGEDSQGYSIGDQVEEARHELRVLLARAPMPYSALTGATFDAEVFDLVWKSDQVQEAGRMYGWRGIAEAVWAVALDMTGRNPGLPRHIDGHPSHCRISDIPRSG